MFFCVYESTLRILSMSVEGDLEPRAEATAMISSEWQAIKFAIASCPGLNACSASSRAGGRPDPAASGSEAEGGRADISSPRRLEYLRREKRQRRTKERQRRAKRGARNDREVRMASYVRNFRGRKSIHRKNAAPRFFSPVVRRLPHRPRPLWVVS